MVECDERTVTGGGPPTAAQRRRRHDADHRHAVDQQSDQRGPDRDAAHEVLGAVDGVDDPLPTGQDRVTAELFAEDLVVGEDGREAFADHLLAREVGVGDRGEVGFGVDLEVDRAEAPHRQRVGGLCEREREIEVGGGVGTGRRKHPVSLTLGCVAKTVD
ncbi:Uncharacterised protein [Mycobacteroides abscessus subsp. abscessus]|nr:Uncharacterised protein [Mycobacteroides abscessus subsp. abscessus]